MNLSELIRLGSMMSGQAFGDYFDGDGNTCAIGAACMAAGIKERGGYIADFERQHDALLKQPCPACGDTPDGIYERRSGFMNTVLHLNDTHRWTREQIADWVEGIERAQEQSTVAGPVAVTA